MKIARIIMDLGISKKELEIFSNKWIGHKTIILADFSHNTNDYIKRISKLIEKSINEGAEIILFPACTFIYNQEVPIISYLNSFGEEVTVIAGTLNNLKSEMKDIPVRLIINNEYFRIIEVQLPSNKKVYASLENPDLYEMRTGKKNAREYKIMSGSKDIIENQTDEIMAESQTLINKFAYCLDYSKNLVSTDEAIEKLRRLGIAREERFSIIKKHSSSADKLPNLFHSPERIIDNFNEKIVITKGQNIIEEFDASIVKWIQISNISAMVAISSTITNIYKDFAKVDISDNYMPRNNSPVIAFDSGHHQYSGRFKSSLKTVVNSLNKDYNSGMIFLAFWKYKNSNINYLWAEPNSLEKNYRRVIVNSQGKSDFVDIFEI